MNKVLRDTTKVLLAAGAIASYATQASIAVNAESTATTEYKTQLDSAYNSLETAKANVSTAQVVKANAKVSLTNAQTNLENATAEFNTAKSAYDNAVANPVTQEDVDNALAVVNEKQSLVDQLTPVYETAKSEYESATSALATAESELAIAQANYDSAKSAYDNAAQAEEQAEADRLAAEQEQKDAEQAQQKAEQEKSDAETYVKETENTAEEKKEIADKATSEETDAKSDYDEAQAEADSKKEESDIAEGEKSDAQSALDDANSASDTAKSNLETAEKTEEDAKTDYENADSDATSKESEAEQAENEAQEGNSEYDTLNGEVSKKQAEVDAAKNLLDEKTADVETKKEAVNDAQDALDSANDTLSDKKKELEEAKADVTTKEKALEDARKALETVTGDKTAKQQAVKDAEQALEDAKTKATEAEEAYNKALEDQTVAQEDLDKAKSDVELAEEIQEAAQKAYDNANVYQKVVYGNSDVENKPYLEDVATSLDLTPAEANGKKVTYKLYTQQTNGNWSQSLSSSYATQLSKTGTITPIVTTYYYHTVNGITTGTTAKPSDLTGYTVKNKVTEGVYKVVATWDGGSQTTLVEVKDYVDVYTENARVERNDSIVESLGITSDSTMTELEKITAITKYIADNFDYNASYSSFASMYANGGGDCWASTDGILQLCQTVGITAWSHNAKYESGAGSGHYNVLVKTTDGKYYICEAGYTGTKGSRGYSVKEISPYSVKASTGALQRVNAYDITDVEVPEGTTSISSIASTNGTFPALGGVKKVENVHVPSSVTSIDAKNYACAHGTWEVDENNETFANTDNGYLVSKDGETLYSAIQMSQQSMFHQQSRLLARTVSTDSILLFSRSFSTKALKESKITDSITR